MWVITEAPHDRRVQRRLHRLRVNDCLRHRECWAVAQHEQSEGKDQCLCHSLTKVMDLPCFCEYN